MCPGEGWQLNLAQESLQLHDVQQRLAGAFAEHAASGCVGQLRFHIETLFGSPSMTCCCDSCHTLGVVV